MLPTLVTFGSPEEPIEADLYLPVRGPADPKPPIIVLAHGLGAVREMGLSAYAERFVAEGYACLVFDYRHFGGSGGLPRHLISTKRQREDWHAAIAHARTVPGVDPDRVIAWGTSFGGGNVITVAADRPAGLVAVIAQNPFTDGLRSALAMHPLSSVGATLAAAKDSWRAVRGGQPHRIPIVGPTATTALMTAPDAEPGYLALVPAASDFRNEAPARAVFEVLRDRPGGKCARIDVPILFAVCERDSVCPPQPTTRYARAAPKGEVRSYPQGHFAIYSGAAFEQVVADQIDFLRRTVSLG